MSKVVKVLSSAKSTAPEMTHSLKALGKGSMGNGVTSVFVYGAATGALAVIAVGSVTGIVILVKKAKKTISEDVESVCDEEAESV